MKPGGRTLTLCLYCSLQEHWTLLSLWSLFLFRHPLQHLLHIFMSSPTD